MTERLRRWRLVLGGESDDLAGLRGPNAVAGLRGPNAVAGLRGPNAVAGLSADDLRRDAALDALYDSDRGGGLGASAPRVAQWLGDIRRYFPSTVVRVMQRDAMDRLGLRQLLLEPELLGSVQPDVNMVATLMGLRHAIPERSRETARTVVRHVVRELEKRLAAPTRQAVTGALNRAARQRRPRAADIDWNRTIAANLTRYQPEYRTVVEDHVTLPSLDH